MPVDPRVVRGVIGKARVVLTYTQFRYFEMVYADGFDIACIAEFYSVTPQAVYQTLKRAKKIMRDEWS